MSDVETAQEAKACDSWRIRRAKLAATREAAANMVTIANEEDDGPVDMDIGQEGDDVKPTDATDIFAQTATASQHHDQATAPMDQIIAEEELAAIEAAEAAAAAAQQKKKRERPPATAVAESPDEPPAATASAPKKRVTKAVSPSATPTAAAGDKAAAPAAKKVVKRPVQKVQ